MGQEVLYCAKCNIQIRGADTGKAGVYRVQQSAYCDRCVRDVVTSLPSKELKAILTTRETPRSPSPAVRPARSTATASAAPPHSIRTMAWALGGGLAIAAVAVVAVVIVISASSSPPVQAPVEPRGGKPPPADPVRRPEPEPVATAQSTAGPVTVMVGTRSVDLRSGSPVFAGQLIQTGAAPAKALLRFPDGTTADLGPDGIMQGLPATAPAGSCGIFVDGGALTVTRPPGKGAFEIVTPRGSARITVGTLAVVVSKGVTRIDATKGDAVVRAPGGTDTPLKQGFFVVFGAGHDPVPRSMLAGLAGQWFPGKGDGRVVRDSSGHTWDGVLLKAPRTVDGRRGPAADFDSEVQLDVAGLSGSGFPRSGTLAFWLKVDAETKLPRAIFDTYDTSRKHFFVRTFGEGRMGLQIAHQNLGGDYSFCRNAPLPKGQWTHFGLVWDGQARTVSVYLNGALDYSAPVADPNWGAPDQLFAIGGGKTSGIGFIGLLDDIRLYTRPLSAEEIRELSAN